MNIILILNIAVDAISGNWLSISRKLSGAISKATVKTAKQLETSIQAAVGSAGNFGEKWTQGIKATIIEGNGFNSEITVTSDIPFFSVFQNGVTIKGNPFLWLPLSFGDAAGQKVSQYKGQLFMVNRRTGGPPLLLSIQSKKPLFAGLSSVTIKKRWDMASIVKNAMGDFVNNIKDEM